jgi:glycine cleavage system H lipoate-binding protein
MLALLIVLTFLVAVTIDHILTRNPIPIKAEVPREEPAPRPRLVPAIVGGFKLPDNLRYHPGHTWAVAESADLVRVGIDDFAAKVGGTPQKIDLPKRGTWIRQGQRVIGMHHDGREIELVSPVEGEVVAINERVIENPELAKTDPYGDGWLLAVNSPDAFTNFRNLLGGNIARRWMDEAAARLRAFATQTPALVAQDGGVVVNDVIEQLPDADWQAMTKELFL